MIQDHSFSFWVFWAAMKVTVAVITEAKSPIFFFFLQNSYSLWQIFKIELKLSWID